MSEDYKILIAEDEPELLKIMVEILEEEGYQCETARDGLEAREKLEKKDYNLLITDFRMPNMDGAELLFWCRSHGRHHPVIFVSANMERLPKELLALKDCCASLLTKPVSIEKLLNEIDSAKKRAHKFDCGKYEIQKEGDEAHFPGQHLC